MHAPQLICIFTATSISTTDPSLAPAGSVTDPLPPSGARDLLSAFTRSGVELSVEALLAYEWALCNGAPTSRLDRAMRDRCVIEGTAEDSIHFPLFSSSAASPLLSLRSTALTEALDVEEARRRDILKDLAGPHQAEAVATRRRIDVWTQSISALRGLFERRSGGGGATLGARLLLAACRSGRAAVMTPTPATYGLGRGGTFRVTFRSEPLVSESMHVQAISFWSQATNSGVDTDYALPYVSGPWDTSAEDLGQWLWAHVTDRRGITVWGAPVTTRVVVEVSASPQGALVTTTTFPRLAAGAVAVPDDVLAGQFIARALVVGRGPASALRVFRAWQELWLGSGAVASAWLLASCNVFVGEEPSNWFYGSRGTTTDGPELSPLVEWAIHQGHVRLDRHCEVLPVPATSLDARRLLGGLIAAMTLVVDRSLTLLGAGSASGAGFGFTGPRLGPVIAREVADRTQFRLGGVNSLLSHSGCYVRVGDASAVDEPMWWSANCSVSRLPIWWWGIVVPGTPYFPEGRVHGALGPVIATPYGSGPDGILADFTTWCSRARPGVICSGVRGGSEQPAVWVSTGLGDWVRPHCRQWDWGGDLGVTDLKSEFVAPETALFGRKRVQIAVEYSRQTHTPHLDTLVGLTEPMASHRAMVEVEHSVLGGLDDALGRFRI